MDEKCFSHGRLATKIIVKLLKTQNTVKVRLTPTISCVNMIVRFVFVSVDTDKKRWFRI